MNLGRERVVPSELLGGGDEAEHALRVSGGERGHLPKIRRMTNGLQRRRSNGSLRPSERREHEMRITRPVGGARGSRRARRDRSPHRRTRSTNRNSIAQNTIPAQPPNASAPPASAVFMAMVQGSVYRRGQRDRSVHAPSVSGPPKVPARVRRTPPSPRPPSAVLKALFPAQHDALQAQYDALARRDSRRAGQLTRGSRSVQTAAEAMLAQGHDGRAGRFRHCRPAVRATGSRSSDRMATRCSIRAPGCARAAVPRPEFVAVPDRRPERALTSAAYAADVNEVEALGALDSPFRLPDETTPRSSGRTDPRSRSSTVSPGAWRTRRGLDVTDSAAAVRDDGPRGRRRR